LNLLTSVDSAVCSAYYRLRNIVSGGKTLLTYSIYVRREVLYLFKPISFVIARILPEMLKFVMI